MVKDYLVIIPPKFLWSFHHSFNAAWSTKKYFLTEKKITLIKKKKKIKSNFFFKSHRNYGDIMPGFGKWSKSIIFMVKTFTV